jgi:Ca2+-binding EF-hand superfamily protein
MDQMPDHALRKLFRFVDADESGVVSLDELLVSNFYKPLLFRCAHEMPLY